MRPEKLYLTDIVEAAEAVERFYGATKPESLPELWWQLGDTLKGIACSQRKLRACVHQSALPPFSPVVALLMQIAAISVHRENRLDARPAIV